MADQERSQLDGTWALVELDGAEVDSEAPCEVSFDSGQVSGRVGVNRFHGSYTVTGDMLEFLPAATTRMAGPLHLMDVESRFHQALQGEHTLRIETRLVLGDLVLVLQPDAIDDQPGD